MKFRIEVTEQDWREAAEACSIKHRLMGVDTCRKCVLARAINRAIPDAHANVGDFEAVFYAPIEGIRRRMIAIFGSLGDPSGESTALAVRRAFDAYVIHETLPDIPFPMPMIVELEAFRA